MFYYIIFIT